MNMSEKRKVSTLRERIERAAAERRAQEEREQIKMPPLVPLDTGWRVAL